MVTGVGALLEFGLFFAAQDSAGLTKLFVFLTVLFGLGCGLALLITGFSEDGIIGALYTYYRPLGTVLAGDDPAPTGRWIVGGLLVLACILSGILMARNPGAVPKDWLGPTARPSQPGRWTQ